MSATSRVWLRYLLNVVSIPCSISLDNQEKSRCPSQYHGNNSSGAVGSAHSESSQHPTSPPTAWSLCVVRRLPTAGSLAQPPPPPPDYHRPCAGRPARGAEKAATPGILGRQRRAAIGRRRLPMARAASQKAKCFVSAQMPSGLCVSGDDGLWWNSRGWFGLRRERGGPRDGGGGMASVCEMDGIEVTSCWYLARRGRDI
jgi:hypothetical protein